jgi:hypothetical protein
MHQTTMEVIMHRFTLLTVATAAVLAAGCAGTVGYSASASNMGYGADLVYAAPGVQVIADYDEPIFFADSFYWRLDGGRWYRSTSYTGGWVYAMPPAVVLRIDRPHNFVHYRPQGWVSRRGRQPPPSVRDHRAETPRVEPRQPSHAPPPAHAAPRPAPAAPAPGHTAPPQRELPPASKDSKDDDRKHPPEEHR